MSQNTSSKLPGQLSDNRLTALPSTLGELTCLQRLNLSHNLLQELPAGVYVLPDLRSLQLDHNNLTALHDDLGNLPLLEYLVSFVVKGPVVVIDMLLNKWP